MGNVVRIQEHKSIWKRKLCARGARGLARTLVENMVKKNRNRFPIAVLLTIVFSRGQRNAKSRYTWRFHWLSCGNIDFSQLRTYKCENFCLHIYTYTLHYFVDIASIFPRECLYITLWIAYIISYRYIYAIEIHSPTYIYINETAELVLRIIHCTSMQFYIYIVIPSFMSACYIWVLKLNLAS